MTKAAVIGMASSSEGYSEFAPLRVFREAVEQR